MNLRTSAMARLLVMALLLIGLLIPLEMVRSVVGERAARRDAVVQEVSGTWGGPQTIGGPVLVVPYRCTFTNSDGKTQDVIARASFLPESLEVIGALEPDERKRGLFKVIVYRAHVKISGRFVRPDLSTLTSRPVEPLWNEATLNVGVADPRGIARRVALNWNGREVALVPGVNDTGLFASGVQAKLTDLGSVDAGVVMPFDLELDVNGSRDLRVLPAGAETTVRLTSTWPHPSFVGASPDPSTISGSGFSAAWRVPYFGRGYPPHWLSGDLDREKLSARVEGSAFGVSLLQPVDVYQQAERAVKYASLFIVMTFVVFFLWEIVRGGLLHPIQYLFVGFAICVFYLLLLSISEHEGFGAAYAIAASATTLLIALYSGYVLGGRREGVLMGCGLTTLYGFLYLLLRLEDYALLAGSVGLFLMLALLMLATRRVNWYELRLGTGAGNQAVEP
jgi:inner membrane protein